MNNWLRQAGIALLGIFLVGLFIVEVARYFKTASDLVVFSSEGSYPADFESILVCNYAKNVEVTRFIRRDLRAELPTASPTRSNHSRFLDGINIVSPVIKPIDRLQSALGLVAPNWMVHREPARKPTKHAVAIYEDGVSATHVRGASGNLDHISGHQVWQAVLRAEKGPSAKIPHVQLPDNYSRAAGAVSFHLIELAPEHPELSASNHNNEESEEGKRDGVVSEPLSVSGKALRPVHQGVIDRFFLPLLSPLLSYSVAFLTGYFGIDAYYKNRFAGASIFIVGTLFGSVSLLLLTGWAWWL